MLPAGSPINSRLGLQQAGPSTGKHRSLPSGGPKRDGALWSSVSILAEHATSPSLQCKNCGFKFCGGATRIRDHVSGMGSITACNCNTDTFLTLTFAV